MIDKDQTVLIMIHDNMLTVHVTYNNNIAGVNDLALTVVVDALM